MRKYLTEGDLISAEVQMIHSSDGTLLLHARSLKYGKVMLNYGYFILLFLCGFID